MRADDRSILQAFVRGLSIRSRYLRFLSAMKELSAPLLDRLTTFASPMEFALVATIAADQGERPIGVARFAQTETPGTADFAVAVADAWQRHGIGRTLLHHLLDAARGAGFSEIESIVLRENSGMIRLAGRLGFAIRQHPDDFRLLRISKLLPGEPLATPADNGAVPV